MLCVSPAVVANLWDVTDKDIDKFCSTLIETCTHVDELTDENIVSLAAAIPIARQSCQLKYLIGAAPVCYGLPVGLTNHV